MYKYYHCYLTSNKEVLDKVHIIERMLEEERDQ